MKRVKRNYWVDENINAEIDKMLSLADMDSRSDFVNKAIYFYIGFLNTKKTETYLLSTFSAMIKGTIGGTEDRLSRLMYKIAVELAMQNRIIAYDKLFEESAIDQIREIAEKEVNEITGYWEK